jgi:hypothetical protein
MLFLIFCEHKLTQSSTGRRSQMEKAQVFGREVRFRVFCFALAVLTSLTMGSLRIAAQDPPQPVDNTPITLPAPFPCPFDISLALTGKTKTIQLPADRSIVTAPGQDATITNVANPANQVTLNITGAFHQRTEQDGTVTTVVTGRNLLFDPQAGFVLAIGHFSYVFDAAGTLIQPLAGTGQVIDVCAAIQ